MDAGGASLVLRVENLWAEVQQLPAVDQDEVRRHLGNMLGEWRTARAPPDSNNLV